MQEHQAALVLAARLSDLEQTERQHAQLDHYLRLYIDTQIPQDVWQIKQLAAMRRQLRTALEEQALRIRAAELQVEQARTGWRAAHQASAALAKLIERRQHAEDIADGRRQQNEQDAWATRLAFQRQQAESSGRGS